MSELFRYAAFVSYSSLDGDFAKRLFNTLERYVIPRSLGVFDLIGEGRKNRIYPMFRDREELPAGELGERIQNALRASANLIVVCSPNAAASPWVQNEIEQFVAMGRRDRIFAIIADDAPLVDATGADATRASFPPAFKGKVLNDAAALEPLAGDARKGRDGFRNAWLKVVAGLIGVTPGKLIDRDKMRRGQQALAMSCGGALVFILTALASASVVIRNERSELTAYANELVGQGLSLDAMAFALAGLPARGDLIPFTHGDAKVALRATGAGVPLIGEMLSDVGVVSADGRYMASSLDGRLLLLDSEHAGASTDLGESEFYRFSPDGRFLVFVRDGQAFVRRLTDGAVSVLGPSDDFGQPVFSSNGRALLRDPSGVLRLFDLDAARWDYTPGRVTANFSPEGRYLVTVDEGGVGALRDLQSGSTWSLGAVRGESGFAFGAQSRFLVVQGAAGRGRVLDLSAGGREIILEPFADFNFSRNGDVLVTRTRDLRSSAYRLAASLDPVNLGAFYFEELSPDGRYFAGLDWDRKGWLLDTRNGHVVLRLGELDPRDPPNFAFSPDSRFFTYESVDDSAVLYDLQTAAQVDLGDVSGSGLAFSGDSRWLAILAKSYFLAVHDLRSGERLELGPVTSFELSLNARRLIAYAYEEERTVVRDLAGADADASRAQVCAASGRALHPFRNGARAATAGGVSAALRGRPWNPCDWRGLFAFEHGWEGLRQWLRLMRVRHFGAPDYACGEINAVGVVTEDRRAACSLPQIQPPQLWRPTAH